MHLPPVLLLTALAAPSVLARPPGLDAPAPAALQRRGDPEQVATADQTVAKEVDRAHEISHEPDDHPSEPDTHGHEFVGGYKRKRYGPRNTIRAKSKQEKHQAITAALAKEYRMYVPTAGESGRHELPYPNVSIRIPKEHRAEARHRIMQNLNSLPPDFPGSAQATKPLFKLWESDQAVEDPKALYVQQATRHAAMHLWPSLRYVEVGDSGYGAHWTH